MTFAAMKQLSPLFDWDEFFTAAKVARAPLNVEQPKFMQEFNRQLADTSLTEWKTYLKSHLLHEAAPYLSLKPPAPTIDGFTPNQQFFIAWGPVSRRRDPARNAALDGAGRSAPGGEVSRDRAAVELSAFREGVFVQG